MVNKYTALLIDDDSESILPHLKEASSNNSFYILDADSPSKANEILANYSNVIDIVLLDLGFSNSDLQGIDFLSELNKLYPEIPVVILTGSDNAQDIKTAVECIKRGAADYFGKTHLDPYQLFNRITEIVESEKSKIIHRNLIAKTTFASESSVMSVKHESEGNEKYFTYFIYAIEDIAVAINGKHEEFLRNKIFVWRKDLLSLISMLKMDVSISIRFQKNSGDNKQFKIYMIFAVSGNTEKESIENSGTLFKETGILFSNTYLSADDNYSIVKVKDKHEIEKIVFPHNKKTKVRFFKKESIGLKVGDYTDSVISNENTKKILSSITPQKDLELTYERLMNYICKSEYALNLEILIQPVSLSVYDLEDLKNVSNNFDGSNDYSVRAFVSTEVYKYIENPRQVYKTFIYIYSDEGVIPENINMAIGNDLFMNSSNFKTVDIELKPSKINFELLNLIDDEYDLSDIYSFYNTLQLFHPPLPITSIHTGFQNNLDNEKPVIPDAGPILGKIKDGDEEKLIRISPSDLLKHIYITGQTGTGKTTLLYGMILERIYSGNGVAVIDPHGDLIKDIQSNIPENRMNDVIIFNPGSNDNDIFINLLEFDKDKPEQKSFIINEILKIIDDVYDLGRTGGPLFEQYFRNAFLAIMSVENEQYTIEDVAKFFLDNKFRLEILNNCPDDNLIAFWNPMAAIYGDASLQNVTPYIISKLTLFSDNHYVKKIISAKSTNINFREIIDNNKILLVNLSKGKLGSMNTVFLGRILFNKLLMAAYSREDIPENERMDFTFFIDEFHNFVSSDLESAMSEVRKYHIALVLANQTLSQLSSSILASVVGNAGSHIFFRQGINDVYKIADLYSSQFSAQQILNLPNYKCVGRILNDNRLIMPLLIETVSKEDIIKILS
jgi:DNA-binding NarL/FixJ family response regulator